MASDDYRVREIVEERRSLWIVFLLIVLYGFAYIFVGLNFEGFAKQVIDISSTLFLFFFFIWWIPNQVYEKFFWKKTKNFYCHDHAVTLTGFDGFRKHLAIHHGGSVSFKSEIRSSRKKISFFSRIKELILEDE